MRILTLLAFLAASLPLANSNAYNGVPAYHERPGAYSMTRRVSLNNASWTEIDFRAAAWTQACPQLSAGESARAANKAELKRFTVRLVSGTSINIAEEASPSDRYASVDATVPVFQRDWSNRENISSLYYQTSGAVVVEVEIWFDIPPAGE